MATTPVDELQESTPNAQRNFKLTIEYDGGEFCGWQIQPRVRTVQETLEAALASVLQEKVRVRGAGRTDAGVHAAGQVANFFTSAPRTAQEIMLGVNAHLPADVVVREAVEAPAEFDARRGAVQRQYRYLIHNSRIRPALERHRAAFFAQPLEVSLMSEGCRRLQGEHDFSGFRSVDCAARRTVLDLEQAMVRRDGALVQFDFVCRSFLMNMVRIMVGTLVEIGRGKLAPEIIEELFSSGKRALGGPTFPPHGLTLVSIAYE